MSAEEPNQTQNNVENITSLTEVKNQEVIQGSSEGTPAKKESRFEHFFQTFSGFFSSFVIGIAGLVATVFYQMKQADLAQKQNDATFRLERMKVLAANLPLLSSHDPNTISQRCGVMLSLRNSNLLEDDSAISFALELGKDHAACMRDVLQTIPKKNYVTLANAYTLTCEQKYGVSSQSDDKLFNVLCPNEQFIDRADVIAQVVSEDAAKASNKQSGPFELLKVERDVQNSLNRMVGLFTPYMQELYMARQFSELTQVFLSSPGAHLVGALTLPSIAHGESATSSESDEFHTWYKTHQQWLVNYVSSAACKVDCQLKVGGFLLSNLKKAPADYVPLLRAMLENADKDGGPLIERINNRLLWCQIDQQDEKLLTEKILLPIIKEKATSAAILPLIESTALVHTSSLNKEQWEGSLASNDKWASIYTRKQRKTNYTRENLTAAQKKVSFCPFFGLNTGATLWIDEE